MKTPALPELSGCWRLWEGNKSISTGLGTKCPHCNAMFHQAGFQGQWGSEPVPDSDSLTESGVAKGAQMGGEQHTPALASPASCPHSDYPFSVQTALLLLGPCRPPVGSPWPQARLPGQNRDPTERQMGTLHSLWSPGSPQAMSSDVTEGGDSKAHTLSPP